MTILKRASSIFTTAEKLKLSKEYGISISKWINMFSEVKIDNDTILTSNQIKALQKRNAMLEEENLIFKKAIAIFTPHSANNFLSPDEKEMAYYQY